MNRDDIKLSFLIYDNRSGSTYLSALLDAFDEIGVSLESPILLSIMTERDVYKTEKQVLSLLNHIYSDPKFIQWGILQEVIKRNLISSLPLFRRELLYMIMGLYFRAVKPSAKCWVYKAGTPYLIKRIKKSFPDAKFIFIYRDGRAVFCSKKKAISLISGKPMEDDPVLAARTWTKYNKIIDKMDSSSKIIKIRYEALVASPTQEIKKIYKFLFGVSAPDKKLNLDPKTYYEKIPKAQLNLHLNVANKPLVSRIDAWKNEIDLKDAYLYEKTANRELKNRGYPLYFFETRKSCKEKVNGLYSYRAKLLFRRLLKKINKLIYYTSHIRNAREKLLIKF